MTITNNPARPEPQAVKGAMTDAATFHRLVLACMQEHGYAVE